MKRMIISSSNDSKYSESNAIYKCMPDWTQHISDCIDEVINSYDKELGKTQFFEDCNIIPGGNDGFNNWFEILLRQDRNKLVEISDGVSINGYVSIHLMVHPHLNSHSIQIGGHIKVYVDNVGEVTPYFTDLFKSYYDLEGSDLDIAVQTLQGVYNRYLQYVKTIDSKTISKEIDFAISKLKKENSSNSHDSNKSSGNFEQLRSDLEYDMYENPEFEGLDYADLVLDSPAASYFSDLDDEVQESLQIVNEPSLQGGHGIVKIFDESGRDLYDGEMDFDQFMEDMLGIAVESSSRKDFKSKMKSYYKNNFGNNDM